MSMLYRSGIDGKQRTSEPDTRGWHVRVGRSRTVHPSAFWSVASPLAPAAGQIARVAFSWLCSSATRRRPLCRSPRFQQIRAYRIVRFFQVLRMTRRASIDAAHRINTILPSLDRVVGQVAEETSSICTTCISAPAASWYDHTRKYRENAQGNIYAIYCIKRRWLRRPPS